MREHERAWGVTTAAPYASFARRVDAVLNDLRTQVEAEVARAGPIGGFSAPAKGNTLLNAAGFGPDQIAAICENNPVKVGTLAPGSAIPVISDEAFLERGFDTALLLAWNYADTFLERSTFARRGGRFLVPLPTPRVLRRASAA